MKNRALRTLGAIIFAIGFVVGLVVFGAMVWADLEAAMFDTSIRGNASLHTLRCPQVINGQETGTVQAAFENSLDWPVQFFVRAHISEGFVTLMREERSILPLAPGETESLQWTVTADDAAYNRMVLVKVIVGGSYPLPPRQASCGILALDVPFLSGGQLLGLAVAASLAGMALGGGLWLLGNRPLNEDFHLSLARGMAALAGSVLVGMFVAFLGAWLLGLIAVVVAVLMVVEVVRQAVQGA